MNCIHEWNVVLKLNPAGILDNVIAMGKLQDVVEPQTNC